MDRIGGDVRRELGRFGPAGSIARLVEVWAETVGESIARNAWPARVARDGTLHVNTSSSAWTFELSQLAPTILERLQEAAGEAAPKHLRFAPGNLPEPAGEEAEAGPTRRVVPSAAHLADAERLTAEIADEKLRKIVQRAAAASLARAPDGRSF
jgi:hypothetical protein